MAALLGLAAYLKARAAAIAADTASKAAVKTAETASNTAEKVNAKLDVAQQTLEDNTHLTSAALVVGKSNTEAIKAVKDIVQNQST